jgi:benzoyl-CoA reductase/2-hydroxyglutaryl-CoA dehydratase subunit BcrC/BadD/HgdB
MKDRNKQTKLFKAIVRSPVTYRLLRPLLDLLTVRDDNKAFKIWIRFLLDITGRTYAHKQPVIWMSAFSPVEIAYASSAVPYMPEITASLVAYFNQSRHAIADDDTTQMSSNLCSFYRCALGLVLEGYLPAPDLIISSSHLCDGSNKFFHHLSRLYGVPHLMLDPPYHNGHESRRYMIEQLKAVTEQTGDSLGRAITKKDLSRAVYPSNQARESIAKINQLRQTVPSPFSGSEALSYLAGMGFYALGSWRGVLFYKTLLDSIRHKVSRNEGYLPKERFRLLWLHHIRPYYTNDIFQSLAERQAALSFEEVNYLYWPPLDAAKPWESLANKILSNVWGGPLERRIEAIGQMVAAYRIDGVIHFSHWGCRQSCGGAGVICDWLKDKGIPSIILPGDGADPDNYSPGQTRTRLEALLEMLE